MTEYFARFLLCLILGMGACAIVRLIQRKENNILSYGAGVLVAIATWLLFSVIPFPFSLGMMISWLLIGALIGSLAGMIVTGSREGYGRFFNLSIGLIGAMIGGTFFSLLGIDFGLSGIVVSASDLVSALIGALVFIGAIKWYRSNKTEKISPS